MSESMFKLVLRLREDLYHGLRAIRICERHNLEPKPVSFQYRGREIRITQEDAEKLNRWFHISFQHYIDIDIDELPVGSVTKQGAYHTFELTKEQAMEIALRKYDEETLELERETRQSDRRSWLLFNWAASR